MYYERKLLKNIFSVHNTSTYSKRGTVVPVLTSAAPIATASTATYKKQQQHHAAKALTTT